MPLIQEDTREERFWEAYDVITEEFSSSSLVRAPERKRERERKEYIHTHII
jgi:hypothetical protein